jgi:putative addiction module component (TIGR02574 family)
MTRPAKDIVNAAKRLPESDRLEIVEELLASLESSSEEDVDAARATEVERRSRQITEGIVRPIPWPEVKARAKERARDPR